MKNPDGSTRRFDWYDAAIISFGTVMFDAVLILEIVSHYLFPRAGW